MNQTNTQGLGKGLNNNDSINQFNYYGQFDGAEIGANGIPYEEDIELLEKQIETVMRGQTATGGARKDVDQNIINMTT